MMAAVALPASSMSGAAQAAVRAVPPPAPVKAVPVKPAVTPAALASWSPLNDESIEFHSPDQLSPADRGLLAAAQPSIAAHAGLAGMDLKQGNWRFTQIACPAFPNHLFVRFARNQGAGDLSLFTVSIPRNGPGRLRVLPILRRGYALFTPAAVNPQSIAEFNRIRAEEHGQQAPAWLALGLCYAALAGADPRLHFQSLDFDSADLFPATPGLVQAGANGTVIVRFTDAAARPRPMDWALTFDRKGKLLKAAHSPSGELTVRRVPALQGEATAASPANP